MPVEWHEARLWRPGPDPHFAGSATSLRFVVADARCAREIAEVHMTARDTCAFQPIVDGRFSRSWTAFQTNVDAASDHRGRRFNVIVDDPASRG